MLANDPPLQYVEPANAPAHRRVAHRTRRGAGPSHERLARSAGRLTLGALLALASATTFATEPLLQAEDLAPFTVTYTVGNNLVSAGTAALTFEQLDDDVWSYSLETRPTGVFKLTGKGRIAENSLMRMSEVEGGLMLQPHSYSYRQDDEARRAVDATFDRDAGTLLWTRRGESEEAPLDAPILDRLSVTLAVMSALRQGAERAEYTVFDSGKLKNVVFEFEGDEALETSLGRLDTIRVLRSNADGSSRTTLTWFAPSLDYMPVKIEQYKRDELVARLTLETLKHRTTEIDEPLIEPEAPVARD